MISYAGIPLADVLPDLAAWIRNNINPADVYQFEDSTWPGQDRQSWSCHGHVQLPPIKINSLFWPRGASQWAVGYFVANDVMLAAIKAIVYADGALAASNLVVSDGSALGQITASMFMIPPRPLSQVESTNAADRQLYLVTLVDARFFWWYKSSDISTATDKDTWAGLYSTCATAIGAALIHDAIDSSYLSPSSTLAADYPYIPILLDAIAYNVGQRIVVGLDGSVYAQSYDTAKASLASQLAIYTVKQAGGSLEHADKAAMAPAGTLISFPVIKDVTRCDTDAIEHLHIENALADLGIPDYSAIQGFTGLKTWHDEAVSDNADTSDELTELAERFTTDWYNFLLGSLDVVLLGIVPWIPEGLHQSVEWVIGDTNTEGVRHIGTRIQRPPWNDLCDRLNHKSSIEDAKEPRHFFARLTGRTDTECGTEDEGEDNNITIGDCSISRIMLAAIGLEGDLPTGDLEGFAGTVLLNYDDGATPFHIPGWISGAGVFTELNGGDAFLFLEFDTGSSSWVLSFIDSAGTPLYASYTGENSVTGCPPFNFGSYCGFDDEHNSSCANISVIEVDDTPESDAGHTETIYEYDFVAVRRILDENDCPAWEDTEFTGVAHEANNNQLDISSFGVIAELTVVPEDGDCDYIFTRSEEDDSCEDSQQFIPGWYPDCTEDGWLVRVSIRTPVNTVDGCMTFGVPEIIGSQIIGCCGCGSDTPPPIPPEDCDPCEDVYCLEFDVTPPSIDYPAPPGSLVLTDNCNQIDGVNITLELSDVLPGNQFNNGSCVWVGRHNFSFEIPGSDLYHPGILTELHGFWEAKLIRICHGEGLYQWFMAVGETILGSTTDPGLTGFGLCYPAFRQIIPDPVVPLSTPWGSSGYNNDPVNPPVLTNSWVCTACSAFQFDATWTLSVGACSPTPSDDPGPCPIQTACCFEPTECDLYVSIGNREGGLGDLPSFCNLDWVGTGETWSGNVQWFTTCHYPTPGDPAAPYALVMTMQCRAGNWYAALVGTHGPVTDTALGVVFNCTREHFDVRFHLVQLADCAGTPDTGSADIIVRSVPS